MQINLIKAHGTQNYFFIIYNQKNNSKLQSKKIIKKICNLNNNQRIDGLLLLSNHDQYDFKMDYYNNDGTWETMCANGARCAALYMSKYHSKRNRLKFLAGDGLHLAEILDDDYVKLQMIPPKYCSAEIKLCDISGFHINSGATHFVINYPKIKNDIVKELGSKIRYHQVFEPRGINVNFYEHINDTLISVKTYEKGIEDLMMSCGSGSVACAYHLSKIGKIKSPVSIKVLGGILKLDFNSNWSDVWLSGHAAIKDSTIITI